MPGDPAADPHADGGHLVHPAVAVDPDPGMPVAPPPVDPEAGENIDDPALQRVDIGAHIGVPALQIQHHIGDALARAMPGPLPATAGLVHRNAAGVHQVLGP